MLAFGRAVCGDGRAAGAREWLVTNGLGGYAGGTIAGTLTRRYHGLLIAALKPPVGRALLVTKLDETAHYDGRAYPLHADHWADGRVEPAGFAHLERFHLEGTTPVWTFAVADARLEKRVWMQAGANTTYVTYALTRATLPLRLDLQAIVNDRDHHGNTPPNRAPLRVEAAPLGLRVELPETGAAVTLLSDRAAAAPRGAWRKNYFLSAEAGRGEDPIDANFHAGDLR